MTASVTLLCQRKPGGRAIDAASAAVQSSRGKNVAALPVHARTFDTRGVCVVNTAGMQAEIANGSSALPSSLRKDRRRCF
ncbi:hypothetical protein [Jiella pacifica]|uniref:Uncharacterized protein n=1 Tax=Jiella pacifica TaxID=2696469 RepID=A0A6N9T4I9_9HYPH|nr:hypothetical protein [Jiella pacifica]NDW04729.1 hypothetical protein [Jiella pacifica]